MNELQPPIVQSEYQDALQSLHALTRDHEKVYRLEVGLYILQRFFGGSAALYGSNDRNKESKFKDFITAHKSELAEMALSDQTLRRCVRVRICYDALPPSVRDRLGWSATLAISTVPDPNQRARIAMATIEQCWTVAQVEAAVALDDQHRLWDAAPDEAGLQLPEPKDPPPPQPGRLAAQSEKWTAELGGWLEAFGRVDASKLSAAHVARMKQAVAAARGQLDELERRLWLVGAVAEQGHRRAHAFGQDSLQLAVRFRGALDQDAVRL